MPFACNGCAKPAGQADWSDEFGVALCPSCYRICLAALQGERERTVSTATRTHFDNLRRARDSGVWLGTD